MDSMRSIAGGLHVYTKNYRMFFSFLSFWPTLPSCALTYEYGYLSLRAPAWRCGTVIFTAQPSVDIDNIEVISGLYNPSTQKFSPRARVPLASILNKPIKFDDAGRRGGSYRIFAQRKQTGKCPQEFIDLGTILSDSAIQTKFCFFRKQEDFAPLYLKSDYTLFNPHEYALIGATLAAASAAFLFGTSYGRSLIGIRNTAQNQEHARQQLQSLDAQWHAINHEAMALINNQDAGELLKNVNYQGTRQTARGGFSPVDPIHIFKEEYYHLYKKLPIAEQEEWKAKFRDLLEENEDSFAQDRSVKSQSFFRGTPLKSAINSKVFALQQLQNYQQAHPDEQKNVTAVKNYLQHIKTVLEEIQQRH